MWIGFFDSGDFLYRLGYSGDLNMDDISIIKLLTDGGFAAVSVGLLVYVVRYFMKFIEQQREDLVEQRKSFQQLAQNHFTSMTDALEKLADKIDRME